MQNIIITKVTTADAEAIARIYNRYIADTTVSFETRELSADEMAARIETISAEYPYFVGEIDGAVAGYCYAHLWKERAAYAATWETTIYLAEEYTGRGIGKALMDRLVEACREMVAHALIACITTENTGSVRFHERLGFSEMSHFREVGRKFGRWLDVTDMELILQPV